MSELYAIEASISFSVRPRRDHFVLNGEWFKLLKSRRVEDILHVFCSDPVPWAVFPVADYSTYKNIRPTSEFSSPPRVCKAACHHTVFARIESAQPIEVTGGHSIFNFTNMTSLKPSPIHSPLSPNHKHPERGKTL